MSAFEPDSTEPLGNGVGLVRLTRARIEVQSGPSRGRGVALESGSLFIGSSRDAGLQLDDRSVSRQHAEIRLEEGRCLLVDLGSTNGTFLNGSRIREAWLSPGDRFQLGRVELLFEPREEEVRVPASTKDSFGELYGKSLLMRRLFGILERVAPTSATVLVQGESGTGKELVARAFHSRSARTGTVVDHRLLRSPARAHRN